MKKVLMFIMCVVISTHLFAQVTTETRQFFSESLNQNRTVVVHKPDSISAASPCPVLIFLPGWTMAPGEFNMFNSALTSLLNANQVKRMLIVVPDGSGGIYTRTYFANSPVNGKHGDYIVKDLVQWIKQEYPVKLDRRYWILGGFSMGGGGSARLALASPEIFSGFASFCGDIMFERATEIFKYINTTESPNFIYTPPNAAKPYTYVGWGFASAFSPDTTNPYKCQFPLVEGTGQLRDSIFGSCLRTDAFTLARQYFVVNHKPSNSMNMYIRAGSNDSFISLYAMSRDFSDSLKSWGITHNYGAHTFGHDFNSGHASSLLVWADSLFRQTVNTTAVPVDGGTFTAGTTSVTISSFKMDKYEVTNELWTEVRNWALTHGYAETDTIAVGRNGYNPVGTNNPVTEVNWYDVVKWCNAHSEKDGLTPVYYTRSAQDTVYRRGELNINVDAVKWTANGYRLPTEAEWEFAAKGGTQAHVPPFIYSGSNTVDDVAWYNINSGSTTHSVGTKQSNELGIYDMSGNVWEWCWDWYGSAYPSGGTIDPKGPSTTQGYRLLRGGSFDGRDGVSCRVVSRVEFDPSGRLYNSGFRRVQGSHDGTGVKSEYIMPQTFVLAQNYPNPFNPATTIRYSLPSTANVKLAVYDLLGREITTLVNEEQSAGWKEVVWNAGGVSSGIYFYKLTAGNYVGVKKLMLLK